MRRILHIADLHLGFEHRYLGDRAGKRAEEALQTLERIVDWALEDNQSIAAVLIAGDLFETHLPDPILIGRVITTLKRIPASGRTLVTVPGNHDEISYPESVYHEHAGTWPGVLVTSPYLTRVAAFNLGNTSCEVHSLAYTAGISPRVLELPEPARPGDAIRIALLHGTLDAMPADRSYRIDSETLIAGGFAYAALGHIHKPGETRLGDGLAVYPGTPNGKGFDDPGVEELVVVAFRGGLPTIEHLPFAVRPIRTQRVDLARHETQESLITELGRTAEANAIVRLELFGPRPGDYNLEHLKGRLQSHYFHLDIDDHSVEISLEEIDRLAQQPTIKGLFTRMMREKIRAAGDEPGGARLARKALMMGLTAFEDPHTGTG
jgi:DNA repair exonuclease SbcCD nuclease subunit